MVQFREINSIRFKRIHIYSANPANEGKSGHWWFEIGESTDPTSESYGWWPKSIIESWSQVFIGIGGILNNDLNARVPPRDPHHGENPDEEFHPLIPIDDGRTAAEIEECLRKFARSYSGKWQWAFGYGQNCHNFQRLAMQHCRLMQPQHVRAVKL